MRAARLAAGVRADVQDRRHLRRPSSRPTRRTTTRPTRTRTRSGPATGPRSSSSARARTASARASSSTTAASTPASPCATPASRRSWSTATPRRCRPTTTPATASTSSRSPTRTCSTCIEAEQADSGELVGVIVALGGQTPLKLAGVLPDGLVLGTSAGVDRPGRGPRALERPLRPPRDPPARRRHRGHASTRPSAIVERIGYPVLVRPVLRARRPGHGDRLRRRRPAAGHGRARRLRLARARRAGCRPSARCWSTASSRTPPRSTSTPSATHTGEVVIGGVMEHVEEAGVHSGDSRLRHPAATRCRAETIGGHRGPHPAPSPTRSRSAGLINVQYAVKASQVFVIEANPRASRTVPFVAKATGVPLVKVAARVMVGATLAELRAEGLLRRPGRRRPRRGEGGGAALQPLPRRRRRARPGDALDRRGHGHRPDRSAWRSPRARSRPATGCPSRARCSSRWPTATRPPASRPRRGSSSSWASRIAATAGTADAPRGAAASRSATRGRQAGRGRRAPTRSS